MAKQTASPNNAKRFLVDSAAALVFFTIVAGATELFIANMTPSQVLSTRLASIPAMLITSRPYGIWRDFVFSYFSANQRNGFWRTAIDALAFVSFQLPVYAAILWFAGADTTQIVSALLSSVFLMIALSRPFGLFLDWCRRIFGVERSRDA